uniref:Secreted protein n=1 Tax=Haemonchus placei TaxID=6290 RepID=A0A0N4VUQ0_HAEPC
LMVSPMLVGGAGPNSSSSSTMSITVIGFGFGSSFVASFCSSNFPFSISFCSFGSSFSSFFCSSSSSSSLSLSLSLSPKIASNIDFGGRSMSISFGSLASFSASSSRWYSSRAFLCARSLAVCGNPKFSNVSFFEVFCKWGTPTISAPGYGLGILNRFASELWGYH